MNRYFYFLIIAAVLIGNVSAGTVVLTGSCSTAPVQSNITFTLANSGNDSAANLVLTPHIQDVQLKQGQYTLSSLPANSTNYFNITFSNATIPGSYSDYFVLGYVQGSNQPFSALFPCIVNLYNSTVPEVVASANVINKGSTQIINVSLFNEGTENLMVNVSLLLPPTLSPDSNTSFVMDMGPYAQKSLNFSVQTPPSGASYSAAVSGQYEFGGMHYASESLFIVSGPVGTGQGFAYTSYLPFLAVIIVILVIVALIARRLMHRKRKNAQ